MAYVRSIRELSVDEDPIAAAVVAILPVDEGSTDLRWDNLSAEQEKLITLHPETLALVGGSAGDLTGAVGDGSGGSL